MTDRRLPPATLNPAQRRAVEHPGGPLLVFAGAGSGKTRVITHRIAFLVERCGVPPWRALAVTFTNKAAGEMRERLATLLGPRARLVRLGTFHAVSARLLRRHAERVGVPADFAIYDEQDQLTVIKRVLREANLDERHCPPRALRARIGRLKQELATPQSLGTSNPEEALLRTVWEAYEERLRAAGALDFADLVSRLARAMSGDEALRREVAADFEHVLVDEFQDTDHAQMRLLLALCAEHRNLTVVGDDDQAIYRWRGADRRNILDFRRHFPDAEVVKLEQNYRSTRRILRGAHAVVRHVVDREPKELWTDNEEGAPLLVVGTRDEHDEARTLVAGVQKMHQAGYRLDEMVVFYRIHAMSRVLEGALRAASIPYRVVGGVRFYDRAEVKDLLAYLRLLVRPQDDVSLLRMINTPPRGIGKTTVERLLAEAARRGVPLAEMLTSPAAVPSLRTAARKRLSAFHTLLEALRAEARDAGGLAALAEEVLERSGYRAWLEEEGTVEAEGRLQNLEELLGSMQEFDSARAHAAQQGGRDVLPRLAEYLEEVSLASVESETAASDQLTLMTVHAAKGLEFPVVFVVGMEEETFPFRGADPGADPEEMEEERRLAYVAITRARERLVLSWAAARRLFGLPRSCTPSRFLRELPPEDVRVLGAPLRVGPWTGPPPEDTSAEPRHPALGPAREAEGLRPGMRVVHARFGEGRVEAVEPASPPRATVLFPGWGRKRIVASFLQPVS